MDRTRWNERYAAHTWTYGTDANVFLAEQLGRLSSRAEVLELGAGEGRNAVHYARHGHRVTVVDYAEVALEKAARLAAEHGVELETIQADVTTWDPAHKWDAVLVSFLQIPPEDRQALYALIQRALRPGGWLFGVWYRPEQTTDRYDSGGPKSPTVTVPLDELRAAFPAEGVELAEAAEMHLDEGPFHQGLSAVSCFVWRKPPMEG